MEAANRDELHLDRSHVVSIGVLLGNFRGEHEDIFRPVHFFEDNDFFFDIYAKDYFHKAYQIVKEKKIREVKRLMVYSKDEELQDPRSIKLMQFHSTTRGYSYKVIHMQHFRSLARDYRLDFPRDFGIYGNKYVYCARFNLSENIIGYWLRNSVTVAAFIKFFEGCWNSPGAFTPPHINSKQEITLEELFKP